MSSLPFRFTTDCEEVIHLALREELIGDDSDNNNCQLDDGGSLTMIQEHFQPREVLIYSC
jgi:hypothetical protein